MVVVSLAFSLGVSLQVRLLYRAADPAVSPVPGFDDGGIFLFVGQSNPFLRENLAAPPSAGLVGRAFARFFEIRWQSSSTAVEDVHFREGCAAMHFAANGECARERRGRPIVYYHALQHRYSM